MPLEGKTVLITGASRGLGRTLTQVFAEAGCRLALMSRSRDELKETTAQAGLTSEDCLVWPGDVSQIDQAAGFVQAALERFSSLDILINNAAVIGPPQFLDHQSQADWSKTVDIDLKGPACLCREALHAMLSQSDGTVINLSSGLARMAFPRFNAYCVAKAGLEQMTRCLAEEFARSGVLFYCVDPGVMDTSMQREIRSLPSERITHELKRQFQQMKQEGHLRSPGETAELITALADHRPRNLNGRTVSLKDLPDIAGR